MESTRCKFQEQSFRGHLSVILSVLKVDAFDIFERYIDNLFRCNPILLIGGTLPSRLAAQHLEPVTGLHRLADWVRERGLRRAAVTNAPRLNAEQMIAAVGLTDFFEYLVIGSECKRAKPFPDPYLKALDHFGVSPENAFAIEVWSSFTASYV